MLTAASALGATTFRVVNESEERRQCEHTV
jgi:hypothetical protein